MKQVILIALLCGFVGISVWAQEEGEQTSPPIAEFRPPVEEPSPECAFFGSFGTQYLGEYGNDPNNEVKFVFSDAGHNVETDFLEFPEVSAFFNRWSRSENTITVMDIADEAGEVTCDPAQSGTYTISFENSCQTIRFSEESDPCAERRATYSGMVIRAANPIDIPRVAGLLGVLKDEEAM